MDANTYVNVVFANIKWPNDRSETYCKKLVRGEFLLDKDNHWLSKEDMKCILTSWLHDEFGECPIDFEFQIISPLKTKQMKD